MSDIHGQRSIENVNSSVLSIRSSNGLKFVLFSVLSGLVGLSLSYALSITNLLSGLIFSFAQTEMQLVSIERTEEYSTNIPQEPQEASTEVRVIHLPQKLNQDQV